jgi:catechol 2,3-dioxygenase
MASEGSSNPVLHHVNLKTTRLQEMIDWYGLVIGTRVIHQFVGGAWLSNDATTTRGCAGRASSPTRASIMG